MENMQNSLMFRKSGKEKKRAPVAWNIGQREGNGRDAHA
jgi:hypothetical protein